MRSLLLHAHDDANFETRLQVALDLARTFDAHLTCLQNVEYDVTVPGDFYGGMSSEMVTLLRERADAFRASVEAKLKNEDVRWDWVSELGPADNRLLSYSALSDLVIVGGNPSDGEETGPASVAGSVAIHAKGPVLVVPQDCRSLVLDGPPAMVAWNGSIEASRALRAAVPFLSRASAIYLATVESGRELGGDRLPPVDGAEYLNRHGLSCEILEIPRDVRSIANALWQTAAERDAGYLVMGAYGHSRMLETLFGGVTRSMLEKPRMPLLLAH